MIQYKNLAGNSGVYGYETSSDSITVEFKTGSIYLYTIISAGAANILQMQRLAVAGKGLGTFINTTVRDRYAKRIR